MTDHNYREQDGCGNCKYSICKWVYHNVWIECKNKDAENKRVNHGCICDRHRRRDDDS